MAALITQLCSVLTILFFAINIDWQNLSIPFFWESVYDKISYIHIQIYLYIQTNKNFNLYKSLSGFPSISEALTSLSCASRQEIKTVGGRRDMVSTLRRLLGRSEYDAAARPLTSVAHQSVAVIQEGKFNLPSVLCLYFSHCSDHLVGYCWRLCNRNWNLFLSVSRWKIGSIENKFYFCLVILLRYYKKDEIRITDNSPVGLILLIKYKIT